MGLFKNIMDNFNSAEFEVAPNKKLKTISQEFKKSFDLSLVFYKGNMIADADLTLTQLNKKTSKKINTNADGLKIKGSLKIKNVENLFLEHFGVKIQIKDASAKKLIPDNITIGQAVRGEY